MRSTDLLDKSGKRFTPGLSLLAAQSAITPLDIMPKENTITLPLTILITDTEVYVEADPRSYVGFSKDGVLHGAGYVGEAGSATIAIEPFAVPGEIDVVITCHFHF